KFKKFNLERKKKTVGNTGYSSLRRNFLPKILAVLLSFSYSGKVLRTFSATNHSQTVVKHLNINESLL
ncbi:hypothetical protein QRD02_14325, partial [Aequorivita sp. SDUM287046]